MSYITKEELSALQESSLDRNALCPFLITHVRNNQLSIARHYGGCTFHGSRYIYIPGTDELIRDDVLKFVTKMRKEAMEQNQCPLFSPIDQMKRVRAAIAKMEMKP